MSVPTCEDCGRTAEEADSEIINELCDECDRNYTYCNVCKKRIDGDEAQYRHRHVYWTEHGEWKGVGGEDMEESDYEKTQASLHLLCDLLGHSFAQALTITIRLGLMGFNAVHFCGTTFGYDSVWFTLHGPKQNAQFRHGYDLWMHNLYDSSLRTWAEQFGIPDIEEELTPAIQWLIGLDNDLTPDANNRTLTWLEKWLARPEPVLELAPLYS